MEDLQLYEPLMEKEETQDEPSLVVFSALGNFTEWKPF